MKRLFPWIAGAAVLVAAALVWISLTRPSDNKLLLEPLRLQLQWFDQAQFAGFYLAKENGYYEDERINLTIVPGGYTVDPIQVIRADGADIGISTGNQVLRHGADGKDIRAIATVFCRSLACFMSKATSPVAKPEEFVGKKVGIYPGFDTGDVLAALLHRAGIAEDQLDIQQAGAIEAFDRGDLDVFPSFVINEPLLMEARGVSVHVLRPEDFGIRFYSDTLFTTAGYLQNNRDLVVRFLRATRRGWEDTARDPDAAIESMYAQSRAVSRDASSRAHQVRMLEVVLDNLRVGSGPLLDMDRSRWEAMEAALVDAGRLSSTGSVSQVCDFEVAHEARK